MIDQTLVQTEIHGQPIGVKKKLFNSEKNSSNFKNIYKGFLISAGFLFGESNLVEKVPYDPNQQQHANAPPALY